MTSSTILDLTRQALMLVLLLSLPIVLIATVTGLVVAILQAVTQVQDANIGIAVRLIAVMVALVLLSGWLGSEVLRFAQQALERMFVSSTGVF
ncbi:MULTISPECIES: type III secretion system export apparatus subunit SctS [Burkholderia]|jgi:type III secretion protein S|uniref:EscS/YscS/HrcS family type III secretion system export apparatus protein n=3 Tax=Burkholderia multivorans TaxID=87883 RepID=A0A0H3KW78_BURM1|nr:MULTISPECIES: type III secretion system export apparatus subunit SctS [Burkholderia]ABX17424.1 type III secretion protein, HrpO family [Burkholderia multivorans ATCC 17616]AIO72382.1 type III secretion, HrpO family protein [Burkholderia multivorans]AJY15963.1 type III secretion, HrpO family protein [Burkholderia multivorans ATCC BAA-247]AOJ95204.1 type III secretion protein HrpO [Burkholderia multivorans]AOK65441.1 type III secretion protein HrpO [Burkholderia multivorans]